MLALAVLLLGAAAALRGPEYDEQYTLFLTAGVARPAWSAMPFTAGEVQAVQAEHAGLAPIARDLRATDVHPPLYFWAEALWRRLAGGGLFAARLFSVLCGVAALAAVAVIASRVAAPPALAMLLTLGCYGFAYTATIARGFALAQALTLCGVAVLLAAEGRRSRTVAAGLLLGAATFANYLAVFVLLASPAFAGTGRGAQAARMKVRQTAPSILPWTTTRGPGQAASCGSGRTLPGGSLRATPNCAPHTLACGPGGTEACGSRRPHAALCGASIRCAARSRSPSEVYAGAVPFLLADLWFFAAQHGSRTGQFPPFDLLEALPRLARYAAANLFGGLSLYVSAPIQPAVAAVLALLTLACAALVAARWRYLAQPAALGLLAAASAPPLGLLLLGLLFHNTPIELRYLSFATPFAALLLAGALASLPRLPRRAAIAVLLAVQATALAGLMTRSETMQPARATAAAAARVAQGGLVLLPRGNDGVGIVGAFAIEAPPAQRLLVVDRDEPAEQILARIGNARRVVLALMAQDDASRATLPAMRAAVSGPCWRRSADGFNVVAFDNICEGDTLWSSSRASR